MADEWLAKAAEFYGITMEQAQANYARCQAQGNDPSNPICVGCAKHPAEIDEYVEMAAMEETTPDRYVIKDEGTYNSSNGHFLCTACYIKNGSPSSPRGWKCP